MAKKPQNTVLLLTVECVGALARPSLNWEVVGADSCTDCTAGVFFCTHKKCNP